MNYHLFTLKCPNLMSFISYCFLTLIFNKSYNFALIMFTWFIRKVSKKLEKNSQSNEHETDTDVLRHKI